MLKLKNLINLVDYVNIFSSNDFNHKKIKYVILDYIIIISRGKKRHFSRWSEKVSDHRERRTTGTRTGGRRKEQILTAISVTSGCAQESEFPLQAGQQMFSTTCSRARELPFSEGNALNQPSPPDAACRLSLPRLTNHPTHLRSPYKP